MHDDTPSAADLETAAWAWLAYESGLSLARVKHILLEQALPKHLSLHEISHSPAAHLQQSLAISPEEAARLRDWPDQAEAGTNRLVERRRQGLYLLRCNQEGYPATLHHHLPPAQLPLLLSLRGDAGLLDLPAVLPWAGVEVDDSAAAWTTETLLELAAEGALALLRAQPGLDAVLARALLHAQAPVALILAQGLGAYDPPPGLAAALEAGRCLLLSPFPPDQTPAPAQAQAWRGHASHFAHACAHALLLIAPPYPAALWPEQPCFLRPGAPATVGCRADYSDAETLFLRLMEAPAAAAAAHTPLPPAALPDAPPAALPEAPIDTDALIQRLSELGSLPDALAARLRTRRPPSTPTS